MKSSGYVKVDVTAAAVRPEMSAVRRLSPVADDDILIEGDGNPKTSELERWLGSGVGGGGV